MLSSPGRMSDQCMKYCQECMVSSCDCLSYYLIHDSQDEIEFDVDTVKIMTIIIHVVSN